MVVRNAVITLVPRATAIRSWFRISLLTAATISGVRPWRQRATACSAGFGRATTSSSQSRNPPTVRCATGWNAARSWVSMISRVTSSVS